jgi:hypothetical protein
MLWPKTANGIEIAAQGYDERVTQRVRARESRLPEALVAPGQLHRTDLDFRRKIRPVTIDQGAAAGVGETE